MYIRQIVCLANSRRNLGYCFAGKLVGAGERPEWIRPVSARETQEISPEESGYQNGMRPDLLDLIRLPLKEQLPHAHQTENHQIDGGFYWVKSGRLHWDDLAAYEDTPDDLWPAGISSRHGLNDKVPFAEAAKCGDSLRLIRPEHCRIVAAFEERDGVKRPKVRVDFLYRDRPYRLSVTDMVAEEKFRARAPIEYAVPECRLCISLSECFRDRHCYKLCAAIITPKRAGEQ